MRSLQSLSQVSCGYVLRKQEQKTSLYCAFLNGSVASGPWITRKWSATTAFPGSTRTVHHILVFPLHLSMSTSVLVKETAAEPGCSPTVTYTVALLVAFVLTNQHSPKQRVATASRTVQARDGLVRTPHLWGEGRLSLWTSVTWHPTCLHACCHTEMSKAVCTCRESSKRMWFLRPLTRHEDLVSGEHGRVAGRFKYHKNCSSHVQDDLRACSCPDENEAVMEHTFVSTVHFGASVIWCLPDVLEQILYPPSSTRRWFLDLFSLPHLGPHQVNNPNLFCLSRKAPSCFKIILAKFPSFFPFLLPLSVTLLVFTILIIEFTQWHNDIFFVLSSIHFLVTHTIAFHLKKKNHYPTLIFVLILYVTPSHIFKISLPSSNSQFGAIIRFVCKARVVFHVLFHICLRCIHCTVPFTVSSGRKYCWCKLYFPIKKSLSCFAEAATH